MSLEHLLLSWYPSQRTLSLSSAQIPVLHSANGSNHRQGGPGSESTTYQRSTRGASMPSPGHEPSRDPRTRPGRYSVTSLSNVIMRRVGFSETRTVAGSTFASGEVRERHTVTYGNCCHVHIYRLLKCVHATIGVPRDKNRCGIHVRVRGGTLSRPYLMQ